MRDTSHIKARQPIFAAVRGQEDELVTRRSKSIYSAAVITVLL